MPFGCNATCILMSYSTCQYGIYIFSLGRGLFSLKYLLLTQGWQWYWVFIICFNISQEIKKRKKSFIFFYNLKLPNSITFCFQRALSFCVPKEIIVIAIYNNICLPLQLQKMICLVLWYLFVKIIIITIRLCSLQSRK